MPGPGKYMGHDDWSSMNKSHRGKFRGEKNKRLFDTIVNDINKGKTTPGVNKYATLNWDNFSYKIRGPSAIKQSRHSFVDEEVIKASERPPITKYTAPNLYLTRSNFDGIKKFGIKDHETGSRLIPIKKKKAESKLEVMKSKDYF